MLFMYFSHKAVLTIISDGCAKDMHATTIDRLLYIIEVLGATSITPTEISLLLGLMHKQSSSFAPQAFSRLMVLVCICFFNCIYLFPGRNAQYGDRQGP